MNIDLSRIKNLVSLFSKLDEEYQGELLATAYILFFKQEAKKHISEKKQKQSKYALKAEIEDEAAKGIESTCNIIEMFLQMRDEQKAEFLIIFNHMSGGQVAKKTDVEVRINQKYVSIEEFLKEIFPSVDYGTAASRAYNNIEECMRQVRDKEEK